MRPPLISLALCAFLAAPASAQITAAVAANVQFAMEEIKEEFKKSSGIEVKPVYGASGNFVSQILSGAPFDVFVAADMDYPDSLAVWGFAAAKPKAYARGKLVLWTTRGIALDSGLSVLGDSSIRRIAVADPKSAPYGREAMKALERAGLIGKTAGKIVLGESISQVSQYVFTGSVDVGIAAKSVVLAPAMAGKGSWTEVAGGLYDPIAQGAVVCKYGLEHHAEPSAKFLAYLYSEPARRIFLKYGYVVP
jgi:molybdate transport system substrate-binding protein